MSLTRSQFELACKTYLLKYSLGSGGDSDDALISRYPSGWEWNEHKSVPGLGYLSRLVSYPIKTNCQPGDEEALGGRILQTETDPAEASAPPDVLTCRQYVVFSPTFQVPALYFSMHHKSGAPLTLQEIVSSALFRSQALPKTAMTTFALDTPDSAFAMLSQGEHPTLGSPCWYLHPCHTAEVVEEIMQEVEHGASARDVRWLEAWFMVLGSLVDFGDVGR